MTLCCYTVPSFCTDPTRQLFQLSSPRSVVREAIADRVAELCLRPDAIRDKHRRICHRAEAGGLAALRALATPGADVGWARLGVARQWWRWRWRWRWRHRFPQLLRLRVLSNLSHRIANLVGYAQVPAVRLWRWRWRWLAVCPPAADSLLHGLTADGDDIPDRSRVGHARLLVLRHPVCTRTRISKDQSQSATQGRRAPSQVGKLVAQLTEGGQWTHSPQGGTSGKSRRSRRWRQRPCTRRYTAAGKARSPH